MAADRLAAYRNKRDFSATPEPEAGGRPGRSRLQFVVQKHWASRLHYDLRLELDGVMKSWAVPKGPSYDPTVKRMAVQVEDHPIAYNRFEGEIPAGQYGAGRVIVWDKGTWEPLEDAHAGYRDGRLKFTLHGHKLRGRWTLVRMHGKSAEKQPPWLLIKEHDEFERPASQFDVVQALSDSVKDLPAPARPPSGPGARPLPVSVVQAGNLRISHPERVVDPASGATKLDLLRHYATVAPLIMEHLRDRPVALLRAPAGVGGELFFQKHQEGGALEGVGQLDPALYPGHAPLLEIAAPEGLLSTAQMNTVEFHTWNACKDRIDRPDRMVLDIDPGEGVAWPAVQEGALLVHSLLQELDLPGYLKTSGGKGLHVVVPLQRRHTWEAVRGFSEALVRHLARTLPQRFVARSGPRNRVGKIFVDYLRNGWGATTVCAWAARARPGLGVSVPVGWNELESLSSGAHWTVLNIEPRLALGNRPWHGYTRARASLGRAMKTLGYA